MGMDRIFFVLGVRRGMCMLCLCQAIHQGATTPLVICTIQETHAESTIVVTSKRGDALFHMGTRKYFTNTMACVMQHGLYAYYEHNIDNISIGSCSLYIARRAYYRA
jgi:hypothetical protein